MGVFTCPVRIASMDGERSVEIDALVDTGSTFTLVPGHLLRQLGVSRIDDMRMELADGSTVLYDLGDAVASVDGRTVTTIVLFGDDDTRPLLGAYTLEGLRLTVDPVNMRIVPLERGFL